LSSTSWWVMRSCVVGETEGRGVGGGGHGGWGGEEERHVMTSGGLMGERKSAGREGEEGSLISGGRLFLGRREGSVG